MDEFSDDGFDDLDDEVLDQLEENAIQATQAQRPAQSQAPVSQFEKAPVATRYNEYSFGDDDLDDTVVINQSEAQHTRPAIERSLPPPPNRAAAPYAAQSRWNQQLPRHPVQQPANLQRPTYSARSQFPVPIHPSPAPGASQRYPAGVPSQRPPPPQSQFARPPLPPGPRAFPAQSQALQTSGAPQQHGIVAALQARLSALEAELTASKGEAAIMRSKYEKAQITHDSEVDRLKKQSAELLAKQERTIETALAAERSAATELQFARQDLREGMGRAKSRKTDATSTTPKKNKTWGLADGFDGVEISVSPTKGQGQKRKDAAPGVVPLTERTPTKGKRKRPAVDSPTFALETHTGDSLFGTKDKGREQVIPRPGPAALPYDFLQLALDHSPFHGQSLTFDLFARFSFPSEPSQTISSIIFQKLPQMGNPQEPFRLLIDFADLMVELWRRCLTEQYPAPIYYLASLVSYVLELNAVAVAPHVISSLIPVCITTCQLVALPRFNNDDDDMSQHPNLFVRQLFLNGNVTHALSLLYLASLGCLFSVKEEAGMNLPIDGSPQTQFWKTVDMEFVVIMLSTKHPEADWFGALSLLWTSVLPTSIGPIPSTTPSSAAPKAPVPLKETPEIIASAVIERVSACMFELPRWAPRDSLKELQVRLAVLKTLVLMSTSPFGIVQLARCDVAIQRVVSVLCWAVDQLYQVDAPLPCLEAARDHNSVYRPQGLRSSKSDVAMGGTNEAVTDPDQLVATVAFNPELGHDAPSLLCPIITMAVLLLHTLVTNPSTADISNLMGRLAASCGGPQRYLLTLARLTFSEEALVLDAGIAGDTVDMAHYLLEHSATPDETEGMSDLF